MIDYDLIEKENINKHRKDHGSGKTKRITSPGEATRK